MKPIAVSLFGVIESWNLEHSKPVLFTSGETGQAGSYACAPIFGETPEGAVWKLPKHGTVRSITAHCGGKHLQSRTIGPGETSWKYQFAFPATPEFPWAYFVEVTFQYFRFKRRLSQTLQVKRSLNCRPRLASSRISTRTTGRFGYATAGESFSTKPTVTELRSSRPALAPALFSRPSATVSSCIAWAGSRATP
jgi:hypothetical protein